MKILSRKGSLMKNISEDNYGEKIKEYRVEMGLTQGQVAEALDVTPGYICNVENGRTAMSLRILTYYAKLMNISLDSLVGNLVPSYKEVALDRELAQEIANLSPIQKEKLLQTLQIWNQNQ